NADFDAHADFQPDPSLDLHAFGCRCPLHSRRRFNAALAGAGAAVMLPGLARADGVIVNERSSMSNLVPAEQVEAAASQQYRQMLEQAARQGALGPDRHPQVVRLRAISQRLIPHVMAPNL